MQCRARMVDCCSQGCVLQGGKLSKGAGGLSTGYGRQAMAEMGCGSLDEASTNWSLASSARTCRCRRPGRHLQPAAAAALRGWRPATATRSRRRCHRSRVPTPPEMPPETPPRCWPARHARAQMTAALLPGDRLPVLLLLLLLRAPGWLRCVNCLSQPYHHRHWLLTPPVGGMAR